MAEKKTGGLDRRQRQIQVGAGLEEAKYNVEFIEFLKKWGPTAMLVVAAAAMSFWGLQKWRESKEAKAGVAFGDVDQAMTPVNSVDVNPEVLVRIAEANESQGAVPVMARLAAAEQWRTSAMKGYRHGGMDLNTFKVNPEDDLTEAGKKEYLDKARQQYQLVVDQTTGNKAKATFTLTGLMGLAAIAETTGKIDEAKGFYKRAQELAEATNYPEYATLAKTRAETADKFASTPVLPTDASVLSWDKPAPVPLPAPAIPTPTVPTIPSPEIPGTPVAPAATPVGAPVTPAPATPVPVTDPSKPATAPEPVTPGLPEPKKP